MPLLIPMRPRIPPRDPTIPYVINDGIRGNGENLKYYLVGFIVLLLLGYLFWWMGQPV